MDYAEIIKNSTDEDEIIRAKKDIVTYFEGLQDDGVISNLEGDEDSPALSFQFSNGIKGGYILEYDPESFAPGSVSTDAFSKTAGDTAGLTEYVVDEENVVGNNKAHILSSFDASAATFTGSYCVYARSI